MDTAAEWGAELEFALGGDEGSYVDDAAGGHDAVLGEGGLAEEEAA